MELNQSTSGAPDLNILVLDDEPFMLKLLARLLEIQGFKHVKTCSTAAFALECVAQSGRRVDIVIFDLNMPEMDGIEFVRALVAVDFEGSLILVSGEDERVLRAVEKLIKAHSIRILGHLRKPFLADRLAALLHQWSSPQQTRRKKKAARTAQSVAAAIQNSELVNYYQPKVELATGRVVGFETLVRWNHAHDGLIPPDEFIGVAEQHGLIDALTRVVTVAAFAQARTWAEAGHAFELAINVSMDNLNQLDFPNFFAQQSTTFGVPPRAVVVEVTESRLMQDPRIALEVLTRLRLKGFRLSIDDFGTGHSSLSQLQDLPFEELKVDRGFVHQAWLDPTTLAIYHASIDLAKGLDMSVVAEGVEDAADWRFLRRTECGRAQGYFIGRPMPVAALMPWLEQWKRRCDDELFPLRTPP